MVTPEWVYFFAKQYRQNGYYSFLYRWVLFVDIDGSEMQFVASAHRAIEQADVQEGPNPRLRG